MKKYFPLLLLISSFSFAQSNDFSKATKEELIKIVNTKDLEIITLKKSINLEKLAQKKNDSTQHLLKITELAEVAELKKSIKETNEVFLREIFDNKYVKKPYLMDADLDTEDITNRIENSNVLIRSIQLDNSNRHVFNICDQALTFNKNYLKLFEIRKNVLNQKYDSVRVNIAIKVIEELPALEINSKLNMTKMKMSNLLKNYLENMCLLKETLDKYRRGGNSESMKQKYSALEKDERYKYYPYLLQIIAKIKFNVNDYTNDDLQPCKINLLKQKEDIKVNKPSK